MSSKKDIHPKGNQVDSEPPAEHAPAAAPVAAEEFDRLLAEEMAKAEPQPPRMTEPFDLAQAIASRAVLPNGAGVEHPAAGSFQFLAEGGEDIDYLYSVKVSARNQAGIEEAVNAMIRAGQGNFRHDGVEIFLHAVSGFRAVSRVPGKEAYATTLNYIFRVRPIEAGPEARR